MSFNISPIEGATEFTTEMLAKNFISIAQKMNGIEEWMYNVDHSVSELARAVEAAKKVKPPKSKFFKGLVIGVIIAPIVWNQAGQGFKKLGIFAETGAPSKDDQQKTQAYQDTLLRDTTNGNKND